MDKEIPTFLSRKQLDFQENTGFSIKISSRGRRANTFKISGMTKNGIFTFLHSATTGLTLTLDIFAVPDIPIWITVLDATGSSFPGETYITVDILFNNTTIHRCIAGFPYKDKPLSWPYAQIDIPVPQTMGRNAIVPSANPAAGAEETLAVPVNVMWKIKAIRLQLVTAAVAGNRRVHLVFTTSTTGIIDCFSSVDQIISETKNYTGMILGSALSLGDDNDIIIPIPPDIIMVNGDTITTETTGLNAGDDFGIMSAIVDEYIL